VSKKKFASSLLHFGYDLLGQTSFLSFHCQFVALSISGFSLRIWYHRGLKLFGAYTANLLVFKKELFLEEKKEGFTFFSKFFGHLSFVKQLVSINSLFDKISYHSHINEKAAHD
jgi:hypothetical protein